MNDEMRPRPYDLSLHSERARLWRECDGYLRTCERHHHGTDFEGRNYARQALAQMIKFGEPSAHSPEVIALVKAAQDAEGATLAAFSEVSDLANILECQTHTFARCYSVANALRAALAPFTEKETKE